MFRASVAVLCLVCFLSWSDAVAAEEADKLFKTGDLLWTSREGGMWTIHVYPKDTKRRVNYKVKSFTERGLTMVQLDNPANHPRYEALIPWHAISAIFRDTDEPMDEAKEGR